MIRTEEISEIKILVDRPTKVNEFFFIALLKVCHTISHDPLVAQFTQFVHSWDIWSVAPELKHKIHICNFTWPDHFSHDQTICHVTRTFVTWLSINCLYTYFVSWQLLLKLQVHLNIMSRVRRLIYGKTSTDSPSGTFFHKTTSSSTASAYTLT